MTQATTDPLQTLLQRHLSDWQTQLQTWALSGALLQAASKALALETVPQSLSDLNGRLAADNWSVIPRVEILSGAGMGGAIGAWAESTQTIYLNSDWLATATGDQISAVLTEEFGHYLESEVNQRDTQGDEGELLSSILFGKDSKSTNIQSLRSENDAVLLTLAD
jgi:hypothetical protein